MIESVCKSKKENKVFVVGLDGATVGLIEKWVKEGKLPNIANLMHEGAYGKLKSVPNLNSAPAWTSMMTGKNPGKHGIFYFYEKTYGSYDIRYINGGDRKSETLWSILSRSGKKVGVVNVPMTYPAEKLNGFMISGFDTPDINTPGATYPPTLCDEIKENIDGYLIHTGINALAAGSNFNKNFDEAISKGYSSINSRAELSMYLMNKYEWDFFMVVFCETDHIQHFAWKYMDTEYSEYDPEGAEKYGDIILKYYQKCDEAIGRLLSVVPEETTVIVHSDHGFGPAEKGTRYLNAFLEHIGLLQYKNNIKETPYNFATGKSYLLGKAYEFAVNHTSINTKRALLKLFPRLRDKVTAVRFFDSIDWSKTRVFGENTRMELWVNQKNRESHGVVSPGIEYDQLIKYLKKELHLWHDPQTGKKVVRSVFEKKEIYHGKYLYAAPDILIIFNNDLVVNGIALKNNEDGGIVDVVKLGQISSNSNVSGHHTDEGVFLMSGKNIKRNIKLDKIEITDIAPTILSLMGQSVPSGMDGRVIADAFEDQIETKIDESIDKDDDNNYLNGKTSGYSNEDAKVIMERLKGLGYIE
ncbi:conserved hypothetical protein [Desulfamplus magnetovallimortis]|uniref:Type I phosphodiesterase/nucleotide pyrophosphatase n=1 Tax=Desulfamplus magnetovallimortis TaxID=1246637 RepID=A0A1W1HD16_9BACT|nr:alkaline phosphatase family protein [Desulfamplus magnetovallimortis]SLM30397.1 conserved hypothetical protein [Desulfamplus magnetovallimortis]